MASSQHSAHLRVQVALGPVVRLDRVNSYRGFVREGALMLTDAAAGAALCYDLRQEDGGLISFRVCYSDLFQRYRLFGQGAHLLADNAILLISPGDASVPIDLGLADARLTLLIQ